MNPALDKALAESPFGDIRPIVLVGPVLHPLWISMLFLSQPGQVLSTVHKTSLFLLSLVLGTTHVL